MVIQEALLDDSFKAKMIASEWFVEVKTGHFGETATELAHHGGCVLGGIDKAKKERPDSEIAEIGSSYGRI